MSTRRIYIAKVTEVENEQARRIDKSLKDIVVTIPRNVIDEDYFIECVQWHIYNIMTLDTSAKLEQAKAKVSELEKAGQEDMPAYSKAIDKRNNLITLNNLLDAGLKELLKALADEYENVSDVVNIFRQDTFAKLYAWSIMGISSFNRWTNGDEAGKGKLESINLSIADEDKIIGLLKDFDLSTTQEQKKQSAKAIELFANEHFATNGGELYKNVSFSFSAGKVNKELYSRSKDLLKHDGKGNIKDIDRPAFVMAMQVYLLCLVQMGVPTINGQKIIKVDEIADCRTIQSVTLTRKSKK